jgi:cytoskeleton protein RodZ
VTTEGASSLSAITQPAVNAAGDALRAAREAAGLSIDAVAQQLKLAPRQVRALEDGDYAALPGRTFVRGFVRNYARLLDLDADAVVAALPDAMAAPAPEQSALGATTRGMGELPVTQPSRNASWSRWLIPLLLIALIGAAAYYELTRQNAVPVSVDKPLAVKPVPLDPIGPPGSPGTPLPTPVAPSDAPVTSTPRAETEAAAQPLATPAPTESVGTASLPITVAPAPPATPATPAATLVIAYRGAAWTEVRDANGQRLLVTTGVAGTSETVSGTPPFDLTLGNASHASVRWRGEAFDLAPHVKGNVARVRLP